MDLLSFFMAVATIISNLVPTFIRSRVFNGDPLRPEHHGYLVSLDIQYPWQNALCSGSIIDKNWILTSAHCFDDGIELITVKQYINESDTIVGTVHPTKIIQHPAYISKDDSISNRRNDIALIKTTASISFGKNVHSIELARLPPQLGHSAIIAGYGESESKPFLPREGPVEISICPLDGLVCSRDKVRAGGGDSGGSLTSKGKLIGVTSASCTEAARKEVEKCFGVYTSVATHYDWIMSVMKSK